ncbi:hypothetical protein HPP92_001625 [Vanilla planifolia]|uniref:Uncharacterized protein n=1 Tax=Vanilla planifolia TaxID=51239 RepID=A0A835S2V8_VANPL|nr:hypothetical protein HPP92_001625 [Vanilla planifolia]
MSFDRHQRLSTPLFLSMKRRISPFGCKRATSHRSLQMVLPVQIAGNSCLQIAITQQKLRSCLVAAEHQHFGCSSDTGRDALLFTESSYPAEARWRDLLFRVFFFTGARIAQEKLVESLSYCFCSCSPAEISSEICTRQLQDMASDPPISTAVFVPSCGGVNYICIS